MRTAPPAVAALAPLATGEHRARRAPACARVPPCCAHARAQVAIVVVVVNINKASNLNNKAMVHLASIWTGLRLPSRRCRHHRQAA